MKALLLAAGFGSRLAPLTDDLPKCMVEIAGRPLLSLWLDHLCSQSVDAILINSHYLAAKVEAFVVASRWRPRITLVHEPKLLGTWGTLIANSAFFESGPFLVAHADNLTNFDLHTLVQAHERRPKHCLATMLTFHTDNPEGCGIVETDEQDVLVGFHEKVPGVRGTKANAAVFIFEPEIFDLRPDTRMATPDISGDLVPKLLGRIYTHHHEGYHRDIGTLASLEQANRDFDDNRVAQTIGVGDAR